MIFSIPTKSSNVYYHRLIKEQEGGRRRVYLGASLREDPVPQLEIVPQGRGLDLIVEVVDLLGQLV